jgi:FMN phosphatase YigB (HAD superfamily)
MLDAILFDLDGTLLPMDNDEFIKGYLGLIAKVAIPWGYTSPEETVAALWEGVAAMVKNNGEMSNYDAFWKRFEEFLGRDCSEDIPKFDKFYEIFEFPHIFVTHHEERQVQVGPFVFYLQVFDYGLSTSYLCLA